MISCILLVAGCGRRMCMNKNKIFLRIGGLSLVQWNLKHLREVTNLAEVVIVTAPGERDSIQAEVAAMGEFPWRVVYCDGGKERQDSVENGLAMVGDDCNVVLVHDGARPMAAAELFEAVAVKAAEVGAALAAVPAVDTIKQVDTDASRSLATLPREELYIAQTPQGFRKDVMIASRRYAVTHKVRGTDDVSLVEAMGEPVAIVAGDYKNIKITTPSDRQAAMCYLGGKQPMMRVGYGYDIHRFKEGRPCILGGVTIESPIGPDGHSDADVLIHALMDALLGAAGLRDIGYYFPPEDMQFKGISSMELLRRVNLLLKEEGLKAYNVDVMVIAEAPKLKPHIEQMKENIARVLDMEPGYISVKATTNEMLGALGRKEGIAAQAVVTLCEREDL